MKLRIMLALIAFGWLVAAAVMAAGYGRADTTDDIFIKVVTAQGISSSAGAYDLVVQGHNVCTLRREGYSGDQVAAALQRNSGLSAFNSGYFVGAAEASYCPAYAPSARA